MNKLIYSFVICLLMMSCAPSNSQSSADENQQGVVTNKVKKTDTEWREILSPIEFHVLREKGTERSFTGAYYDSKEEGNYVCAGCQLPLFSSVHKFKSGTGWPSFYQAVSDSAIHYDTDNNYGMSRTEILCNRCDGHLGHIFNDGPQPTGLRFCVNSASLKFKE